MKSYISSIGIATPPFQISQKDSFEFISSSLDLNEEEKGKLSILYRATGIDHRFSVLEDFIKEPGEFSFFPNFDKTSAFPTVSERMEIYRRTAPDLAIKAIEDSFSQLPEFSPADITHLITVSCTGMYAPGLDIDLMDKLKFRTNLRRTAINFMGCYGAFNALKIADNICRSDSGAKVVIVCVELCTLHLLKSKEEDHLLSGSLFGDGASAVVLSTKPFAAKSLSLESFYCEVLREGKDEMAWHISEFGFDMKLTSYVPNLIKGGIKSLTNNLLENLKLKLTDVDFFAIHPGGKRILQVIEQELGLSREDNAAAYSTLKNYGNMSSPTVLFVLKSIFDKLKENDDSKNILSFAFGPGLTLESMLLKVKSF